MTRLLGAGELHLPALVARFRRAGASLRVRNYRLYFLGQTVSVVGNQMQLVAVAFLVLDLTHSGAALGTAIAARLAPLFVLGPWGGLVADRSNKRKVLYVTQALSSVGALILAVLTHTDRASYPVVLVVLLVMGSLLVLDNPARQGLIGELVERDVLANAVVLNSVSVNVARAVGALLGGALVATLGASTALLVNAATFLVVILSLAMMSGSQIRASTPVAKQRGQLREGWRYTARTPEIALPLLMLAVTGTFAYEYPTTLPLLAVDAFSGDARTYGWMAAAMAVGSVVAGINVAGSDTPPSHRTLPVTCLCWGVASLAAALAPTLLTELALLAVVGYASMSLNATAKSVMQLAARPDMRGRVMSLWAISWTGSAVVGGPLVGAIGEHAGSRWALVAGAIPTLLLGAALSRRLRGAPLHPTYSTGSSRSD
ncbi:MFS transporter [Nocardioides sp. Kera G14]|uniref:MFS transporter n=1 Tax=Nocardioides sp. Kera G14 TaxID=2884264 RepID=UPI001D0FC6E6|nr:MFS transporter [Nocardioides sp. Kera G14]UDY23922.1 MFS transporter [Nocardioides sp. Kera G14]